MSYTLTGIMGFNSFSSSPAVLTASGSVAAGDLVILGLQAGTAVTWNISSIVEGNDSGSLNYIKVGGINDGTNGNALQIWYRVAQSSYTPSATVTYSGIGGSSGGGFNIKVNSTNPTNWQVDTQFPFYSNSAGGSSTVMSWSPGNTQNNNEVVIAQARVNGAVTYSFPGGWTQENGDLFAQMFSTAGTSAAASTGTFNVASAWDVIVAAIFDATDTLTGQAVL